MRIRTRSAALLALALVISSCTDNGPTAPALAGAPGGALFDVAALASTQPAVRISEIHYDNAGTDVGEAIEISGPAGTDLTGWKLYLYNGNGGAVYTPTMTLSGTIPATCGARGVVVQTYAVNGLQNGDPDAVALVAPGDVVVELLSYGGSFTAVGGPAAGMTTTNIGVKESSTTPVGSSLQRNGAGVWAAPAAATFGACNDDDGTPPPPPAEVKTVTLTPPTASVQTGATQTFAAAAADAAGKPVAATITWTSTATGVATVTASGVATGVSAGEALIIAAAPNGVADTATLTVTAPPPPALPATRLTEIHYDNSGTDANEAIEIEGPAGTDLTGWSIVLYTGGADTVYSTRALSGVLPSSDRCDGRGVLVTSYPTNGIQNGGSTIPEPDGFALVNAAGQVVEFLSYEGSLTAKNGPAAGTRSTDIGVAESSSASAEQSLQRKEDGSWEGPKASTFGYCNKTGGPPPASITFSGRSPTADPALPVGFQAQIFATVREGGTVVQSPVVWTSETPAIASIDERGVITALAAGTATFRATALNGAVGTYSLPMRDPVASTTASYLGNAEFGEPADADPSDDLIVRYPQYTSSFNVGRGTPNWVSYELDPSHFGPEDRCNCFTYDAALPQERRYTTADYTGAGAAAGYGIDRGHLARSADRTAASLDNATTFYFSNIIPQAADLNQGPWAVMENYLGNLAESQGKEVYVIAGVAGSKGTVKNEGKLTIPAAVWKVAVILPHDQGLSSVTSLSSLDVVAVIMPNDPGVRNVSWETYKTTVDAVEALSGYDLLALLRDDIEIAVESNTKPPVAALDGPYTALEGGVLSLSGAASTDPDGDALTYSWSFGDGGTGAGAAATHSYLQDGTYTVRLIVTDIRGLADTVTTTATVGNVAPSVAAFAGATLLPGETYAAAGTFADPGSDAWTATVTYGDGSPAQALALSGFGFSLSHSYQSAGTFTVTVTVADDDATGTRTQTVTVLTPAQGVASAISLVDELLGGAVLLQASSTSEGLNAGNVNSLKAKLEAARRQLERGGVTAAEGQLQAVLNELDAMVQSGRLAAERAAPVQTIVQRVIRSITR